MNKNKKIILTISIIGIIATIVGITVWKTTRKTTSSSQQNSEKNIKKLYGLLKETDFKIERNYIKSIEEFEYNKVLGPYHIVFKSITNSRFDIHIDDVIKTKIGKGEINEEKITINLDNTFISEIEKNPETIRKFFIKIKKWINEKENFNFNFLQTNILKNNLKKNTHFSSFFKKNKKEKKLIKDELKNLSKYFFNNNLLNIIKNIKKYNITFDEINKKTKSKDLSIDFFDEFNLNGKWVVDKQTITLKKIKKIKTFLKELKEIKSEIQELISKKIKKICLNLEQQIKNFLKNNNFNQIIIEFKKNNLLINILPSNWDNKKKNLFKEFIFNKNQKVQFEMGEKTKEELQAILEFTIYISTNNETIKTEIIKINLLKDKQNIETQINHKLNKEIKQILINFNKNNSLISILPTNWNDEKKNLFKEFIFNDNLEVSFKMNKKTKKELQSILNFITYINRNKETIKIEINNKKLFKNRKNIETQINNILNNDIKIIFINFNKNNSLINILPTNWNDEKKNLFKEFIFNDNLKISFEMGEKTEEELQAILEFITYININKIIIWSEINNKKLLKEKQEIKNKIKNLLNDEVQQILNGLNDGLLTANDFSISIKLYKKFKFNNNAEVAFEIGNKTIIQLNFIFNFINHINNNKIKILEKLELAKIFKDKQNIEIQINHELNNEVKQIFIDLNKDNSLINIFPLNWNKNEKNFFKEFIFENDSEVTFEIGKRTKEKLQSILEFITYININKETIKTKINNAKLLKNRQKKETQINELLTNEIKQILNGLNEHYLLFNDLSIPIDSLIKKNIYKNFIFNNNLEIIFEMGEKKLEKLELILEFLNYIENNKIKIFKKLRAAKLFKKRQNIERQIIVLLTDEIKQILNGLNGNYLLFSDLSTPLNVSIEKELYKEFAFNDNLDVTFIMGEKTEEELRHVFDFINYINDNKVEILEKLELAKLFKKRQNIETQIKNLLTNKIKQILNGLNGNYLLFSDLSTPLNVSIEKELYKEFEFENNSNVIFLMKEKTEEELQHVLDFINYINDNKVEILEILEIRLFKKRQNIERQIIVLLTDEIKQILNGLNSGYLSVWDFSRLPNNSLINKQLYKQFIFNDNLEVTFEMGEKSILKLQSILEFMTYINLNKIEILRITERKLFKNKENKEKLIKIYLNFLKVQQILNGLNDGILSTNNLPTPSNNIKINKELYKEFVFNDDLKVTFEMGEKTIIQLQSILNFINYINNNKTEIAIQLKTTKLFKNRQNIEIQIKNLLVNKIIQEIILRLNINQEEISILKNKPENISFNKEDFVFINTIVTFEMNEKSENKLQSILNFLNYVNDNKTNIKEQLEKKQKDNKQQQILNLLNNEVQRILNFLNDSILLIAELPVSLNESVDKELYKEFIYGPDSRVVFEINERTKEELQSILDFLNYIKNNKQIIFDIKNEKILLNKKTKLETKIKILLNDNETKQILNGLNNGDLLTEDLPDPSDFSVEKKFYKDFIFNNLEVTFEMGERETWKLQSILDFLKYINDIKTQTVKLLKEKKEFKNKLNIETQIKNLLTNEVQQILNSLNNGYLLSGDLQIKPDSLINKKLYKKFIFNNNLEVLFEMGEKSEEELQDILEFINYINDNKTEITSVLEIKISTYKLDIETQIQDLLNFETIKKILIGFNNGYLTIDKLLTPLNNSINKELYKEFVFGNNSEITLKVNKKTVLQLNSILSFLTYINNNNEELIKQLEDIKKPTNKSNKEKQIKKLIKNNEIKRILNALNLYFLSSDELPTLPNDSEIDKTLYQELEFDNNSNIFFWKRNKSSEFLQSILDFLHYINENKTEITKKIFKKKQNIETQINELLNNKVKRIIRGLNENIILKKNLPSTYNYLTYKEPYREFIFDNDLGVVFEIGNKTILQLQSILNFINYIDNNKTEMIIQLRTAKLLKKKQNIETQIKNLLNDESIKQTLNALNSGLFTIDSLPIPLNNSIYKEVYKNFIFNDNLEVVFEMGERTEKKLQDILEFINHINDKKIEITIQLDKKYKQQQILNLLNNEIKRILNFLNNGVLLTNELPISTNKSINKELYKEFTFNSNSEVTFEIGNKTISQLQSILDFINYIQNKKQTIFDIKNEKILFNQRKKTTSDINKKIKDDKIQKILNGLNEGDLSVNDLPIPQIYLEVNKNPHKEFVFGNNSKVTFEMGEKPKWKLESTLLFIIYIEEKKTEIINSLKENKLFKKKQSIETEIKNLLNNEMEQILDNLNKTRLLISELPESLNPLIKKELYKEFNFDNLEVTFEMGEKTKEKLQSILDFLNYINDNKTEITSTLERKLVKYKQNKKIQIQILLNFETIKKILIGFNDGFLLTNELLVPLESSINKELYKEFEFNNEFGVLFNSRGKTTLQLDRVLSFLVYLKINVVELMTQLENTKSLKHRQNIEMQIEFLLTDTNIKQVLNALYLSHSLSSELPTTPDNSRINKELYKEFEFNGSEIFFWKHKKNINLLQSILDFLKYINNNIWDIKILLEEKRILTTRKILERQIKELLINNVKQILNALNEGNLSTNSLPVPLGGDSINKELYKEFTFSSNSEVTFEMGEKLEEELQSILEFINYIYNIYKN